MLKTFVIMPKCAFISQGRFGNNIFQYIACKLFCKRFQWNYVSRIQELNEPQLTLYEQEIFSTWGIVNTPYKLYTILDVNLSIPEECKEGDAIVFGYFENLNLINTYLDDVKAFFHPENTDVFYNQYSIRDILLDLPIKPSIHDLVIHVRLDDFYTSVNGASNVVSHSYYRDAFAYLIQVTPLIHNVWIVSDKIRDHREQSYMNELLNVLKESGFTNVHFHQKSLLEDWNFCRLAQYFIGSNSSFAWTAMIVGNPIFATIANTKGYPHQQLVPLNHIPHCYVIESTTTS